MRNIERQNEDRSSMRRASCSRRRSRASSPEQQRPLPSPARIKSVCGEGRSASDVPRSVSFRSAFESSEERHPAFHEGQDGSRLQTRLQALGPTSVATLDSGSPIDPASVVRRSSAQLHPAHATSTPRGNVHVIPVSPSASDHNQDVCGASTDNVIPFDPEVASANADIDIRPAAPADGQTRGGQNSSAPQRRPPFERKRSGAGASSTRSALKGAAKRNASTSESRRPSFVSAFMEDWGASRRPSARNFVSVVVATCISSVLFLLFAVPPGPHDGSFPLRASLSLSLVGISGAAWIVLHLPIKFSASTWQRTLCFLLVGFNGACFVLFTQAVAMPAVMTTVAAAGCAAAAGPFGLRFRYVLISSVTGLFFSAMAAACIGNCPAQGEGNGPWEARVSLFSCAAAAAAALFATYGEERRAFAEFYTTRMAQLDVAKLRHDCKPVIMEIQVRIKIHRSTIADRHAR